VLVGVCSPVVRVHLRWFFQSAKDWSISDAPSEGTVCVTSTSGIAFVVRTWRRGGGPRAPASPWWGSLWRRSPRWRASWGPYPWWPPPRLGDLTLTERLGDLDLERKGLLPLLLRGGEEVSQMWINCLFDCLSSAIRLLCSSANVIWRSIVWSRRLICESVVLSTISSGRGGPKIGRSCSGISPSTLVGVVPLRGLCTGDVEAVRPSWFGRWTMLWRRGAPLTAIVYMWKLWFFVCKKRGELVIPTDGATYRTC